MLLARELLGAPYQGLKDVVSHAAAPATTPRPCSSDKAACGVVAIHTGELAKPCQRTGGLALQGVCRPKPVLAEQHPVNAGERVGAAMRVRVSVRVRVGKLQRDARPARAQPGQRLVPVVLVAGLIREAPLRGYGGLGFAGL